MCNIPKMNITFDTNVLDKVTKIESKPDDHHTVRHLRIHELIKTNKIRGFYSDSIILLEGIDKKDRLESFGKGISVRHMIIRDSFEPTTIHLNLKIDQDRPPLNPINSEMISAALKLGIFALRSPVRAGWITVEDSIGIFGPAPNSDVELFARIERSGSAIARIEHRGVGMTILLNLAEKVSKRDGTGFEPFFVSIARINDPHERGLLKRAISEWADGDSIASHIGYQNDYFCTDDFGRSSPEPSIFSSDNRKWLSDEFGVKFLTSEELADLL